MSLPMLKGRVSSPSARRVSFAPHPWKKVCRRGDVVVAQRAPLITALVDDGPLDVRATKVQPKVAAGPLAGAHAPDQDSAVTRV